jgi:hypothetical protein
VLLALTAYELDATRRALWTELFTWDEVLGVRSLGAWDDREASSIATLEAVALVVFRDASGAYDAATIAY